MPRKPHTYLLPELKAINLYRLDRGFTWQQLADDMLKVRPRPVKIPARTLNYLCTRRTPFRRPLHDRTLFGLRRFLRYVHVQAHSAAARRRRPVQWLGTDAEIRP